MNDNIALNRILTTSYFAYAISDSTRTKNGLDSNSSIKDIGAVGQLFTCAYKTGVDK